MKYMLLIYLDEQNPLGDVERQECYAESTKLAQELHTAGKYVSANPLHPTSMATSVRVRDGKRLITDGPFAETREQLGGYFLIDAQDLDEALGVAARVPMARKGTVEVRDAGGDITIGAAGSVKAETTSGSINIERAKGAVEARNSGGNVHIGAAGNQVTAKTSSGSIKIGSAAGKVSAMNSGGDIEIKAAAASVQASTSSGTITANFVAQPAEDCRLEVSGGGVNLTVPKNAGFNLEARSSGGEVESDLPVTTTVSGKRNSSMLQGKLNAGGPALLVRASSGDIRIKGSDAPAQKLQAEDEK
jgi:hypothetical protein